MIYAIKLFLGVLLINAILAPLLLRALSGLMPEREYWRTWMVILAAAVVSFLSFKPIIFVMGVAAVAMFAVSVMGTDAKGRVTAFWMLLLLFPQVTVWLDGFAGINKLLELNHARILALVILLPAALKLAGDRDIRVPPFLRWMDVLALAYPVMTLITSRPNSNASILARMAVEFVLDVLLPYYVTTRGLRNAAEFKHLASRLLLALTYLAVVGVLEEVLHKNVYSELQFIYGVQWQLTHVLMRGSLIRVQSTFPVPIIMAFVMTFGVAFWAWISPAARSGSRSRLMVLALIVAALLSTWSRGPLLGTVALMFCMIGLRWLAPFKFLGLLCAVLLGGIVMKIAGADEYLYDALRVVFGSSSADTLSIDYRRRLLEISLGLIKQAPFLGVPNYAAYMQELKQGEGIIDIVNTYLFIMLNDGLVGLTLFLLPYLVVTYAMIKQLQKLVVRPRRALGSFPVAMIGLIVGSLATIFTTSTFSVMSPLLLLLVALPSAWLVMSAEQQRLTDARSEPAAASDPVEAPGLSSPIRVVDLHLF